MVRPVDRRVRFGFGGGITHCFLRSYWCFHGAQCNRHALFCFLLRREKIRPTMMQMIQANSNKPALLCVPRMLSQRQKVNNTTSGGMVSPDRKRRTLGNAAPHRPVMGATRHTAIVANSIASATVQSDGVMLNLTIKAHGKARPSRR